MSAKPSLFVTFTSPAVQTFGPYARVAFEPADYDCNVLLLLVRATGDDPSD
jgi:hypothetical protein